MTALRRNIVRSLHQPLNEAAQRARRQKIQASLTLATAFLARWQSRLRRAFNSVAKYQKQIARLNRQLTTLNP